MIFKIIYQTRSDAADPHSNFTHGCFVEAVSEPSLERVIVHLNGITLGDFEASSIRIEETTLSLEQSQSMGVQKLK